MDELFEIGPGKAMSRAAREGEAKVPFLRTANVFWDEVDLSKVDAMALTPAELESKCVAKGDLLVCEGGEIGRAAIWGGEVAPMAFQNHIHRLRRKRDDVEPRFYVYFLQSAFTQLGIFEGAGNKTTIPNLSRNRLAALEVPHPPLEDQRAIARALAHVRFALRDHARAASHAEELRRATMQALFTRGLRGEAQKESEIGPIPESWDLVEFSSIREWLQYGTSTRCSLIPATYPVLRIPNIASGVVNVREVKYCDLSDAEAASYHLERGDILFIRTNGVLDRLGECAVYEGVPEGALFASYLIRARVKPSIEPKYAAYFYGSTQGTALVAGRATPAADGKYNLNTGTIDSLPLPLPSTREEQREIVGILDAVGRKVDLHLRKRALLEELFKSLLRQLMTGDISPSDLDLAVLPTPAETRP